MIDFCSTIGVRYNISMINNIMSINKINKRYLQNSPNNFVYLLTVLKKEIHRTNANTQTNQIFNKLRM